MISARAVSRIFSTTSAAVATLLVTATTASSAVPADDATTDRVLQSVSVAVTPDGTLTSVRGSVVETSGDAEEAEATESAYSPQEVAQDLPVRVLTAYRTAEGAGTDLSDLQGYTGRIAIDVTVQNLTVRPQVLSYDVDGTSRSQAALVGSPLAVTASADLGDLPPAKIVTDDDGSGANVTNGVLGQSGEATTVQWAALLAPPTLSSSTEFSLVLDAKSFDVPQLDLSVQPGLVSDPSIQALVDSAFNPASSDELELQSRTIELVGEVNAVLARASSTISDVRSNLTSSAETLGTRTVADLQASTQSVTSNMTALDGALQSLRGDLSSTLESTGSSAVAELDQAVSAVDRMLGDTSAPAPTAAVRGTGCETGVAAPREASSVYGNLLQVAGQLKGYAEATALCKQALEQSILETIGPDQPDAASCAAHRSVTCSLLGARTTFTGIAESLRELSEDAIDLLEPELYSRTLAASAALNSELATVQGIVDSLNTGRIFVTNTLRQAEQALRDGRSIDRELDAVADSLAQVHTDAVAVRDALGGTPEQVDAAAEAFCAFEGSLADGTLSAEQRQAFDDALGHLQRLGCDQEDLGVPEEYVTLTERFDAEPLQRVEEIIASTDPAGAQQGAAQALANLDELRIELRDQVIAALEYRRGPDPESPTLAELQAALDDSLERLGTQRALLDAAVGELQVKADQVPDLEAAINTLVDTEQAAIDQRIAQDAREVAEARDAATEELGTMFERSSAGLRSSAADVTRNGKRALDRQKSDFARTQAEASNRISQEIEGGLAMIARGVTASTRDMEAATALLTADLRKVLLDLGERRVGGGGLLGAMATNAATARSADYQLALATDATTAYANVRARDIDGILLRQAQTDASMQMLADLPAFELDLPAGSSHRTVYSFSIGDGR